MNDVNALFHNDKVWNHQILIFVKVDNDAAPCFIGTCESNSTTKLTEPLFACSKYFFKRFYCFYGVKTFYFCKKEK